MGIALVINCMRVASWMSRSVDDFCSGKPGLHDGRRRVSTSSNEAWTVTGKKHAVGDCGNFVKGLARRGSPDLQDRDDRLFSVHLGDRGGAAASISGWGFPLLSGWRHRI